MSLANGNMSLCFMELLTEAAPLKVLQAALPAKQLRQHAEA